MTGASGLDPRTRRLFWSLQAAPVVALMLLSSLLALTAKEGGITSLGAFLSSLSGPFSFLLVPPNPRAMGELSGAQIGVGALCVAATLWPLFAPHRCGDRRSGLLGVTLSVVLNLSWGATGFVRAVIEID